MLNSNPLFIQLSERLEKIDCMKLVYFKLVNWQGTDPPHFIFLNISQLHNHNHHVTSSNPFTNSTTIQSPSSQHFPIHFKTVPQGSGNFTYDSLVLVGKQKPLHYCLYDLPIISRFELKLVDSLQQPLQFANETVAMLVFEVSYNGPANLSPQEYYKVYSKYQN